MHKSLTTILMFTMFWIGGCNDAAFKGDAGNDFKGEEALFRPIAMRIHPFTQIAVDENTRTPILETRVELLDQMGDVTKSAGRFRFEVYASPVNASSSQQRQVAVWMVPVNDLKTTRQHWDPITRTYVFKLTLDQIPSDDIRLRLNAQFIGPTSQRLTDERIVHP